MKADALVAGVLVVKLARVPDDAPATLRGETRWLSGDELPVQIGVYKRLSLGCMVMYSFFDGAHWLWNCRSADQAVRMPSSDLSIVQTLPWCGLLVPAEGGYGPIPTDALAVADSEGGEL